MSSHLPIASLLVFQERAILKAIVEYQAAMNEEPCTADIGRMLISYGTDGKHSGGWTNRSYLDNLVNKKLITKRRNTSFGYKKVLLSVTPKGREAYDWWRDKMTDIQIQLPEVKA